MSRARRVGTAVAASALVLVLGACGTTTLITQPTTTAVGATTTAPAGTPDELLPRLLTTAYTLSTAIVDGKGREVVAEIDALWKVISSQLPRTEFVDDTAYQIERMRFAVESKHPADADKAALRVSELLAARATAG